MSIATTICPHCGAENLPDQAVCGACGKSLGAFAALKPTIVKFLASTRVIGGLLGGVSTFLTTLLIMSTFCQGLCDLSVFADIWIVLIANFALGYAVGYVLMRFWDTKWMKALVLISIGFILGFHTTLTFLYVNFMQAWLE